MKNTFRIFFRDIKRILTTPAALIVVVALLIIPSLYTWVNVVGFWNPYDNTGNLRVCVVNEDEGGESALAGKQNVGKLIVENLQENTQLAWAFMSRDEALAELEAGEAYAVFIIPQDFTATLLAVFDGAQEDGTYAQPALEYYVNEKLGPVSPKVTDTGATTLERTVNSSFVSVVSNVATEKLRDILLVVQEHVQVAGGDVSDDIAQAQDAITAAVSALDTLADVAASAQTEVADAYAALTAAHSAIDDLSAKFDELAATALDAQNALLEFDAVTLPALNNSVVLLGQVAANATTTISTVAGDIYESKGLVDAALIEGQNVVAQNKLTLEKLRTLYDSMLNISPAKQAIGEALTLLEEENNNAEETLSAISTLSGDLVNAATSISAATDEVNTMAQTAIAGAVELNSTLDTSTIPAITRMLSQVNTSASALSAQASAQHALLNQTETVLTQLSSTLTELIAAFGQTSSGLAALSGDMTETITFFRLVASANNMQKLLDSGYINADAIADFMQSPTTVETRQVYPLNAYGSAMAPLFMNLTFWIGAFMLLVIIKQEVDEEGLKKLSNAARFMGRWLLLALLAALQAIICVIGCLIIGVQYENLAALFFAAAVTSIAYLSIMYTLAVLLQHVGKGICVVLVFIQIPAGTGLYPIEMTSSFFQAIYQAFPFTYGISAMREAICGFYGSQYLVALGVLAIFCAVSLIAGLTLRPLLVNVNRLFARELQESGIMVCEEMQVPERQLRFGAALKAVSQHEDFSAAIQKRARTFVSAYPIVKTVLISVLVGGLVVLTLILNNTVGVSREGMLTGWFVLIVTIAILDIVAESLRDDIRHKLRVSEMSEKEIRDVFFEQARKVGQSRIDDIEERLTHVPYEIKGAVRREEKRDDDTPSEGGPNA